MNYNKKKCIEIKEKKFLRFLNCLIKNNIKCYKEVKYKNVIKLFNKSFSNFVQQLRQFFTRKILGLKKNAIEIAEHSKASKITADCRY
jgi:hypothetical protein